MPRRVRRACSARSRRSGRVVGVAASSAICGATSSGGGSVIGSSPGNALARMAVRVGPGLKRLALDRRDRRVRRRRRITSASSAALRGGVGRPIRHRVRRDAGGDEYRAARVGGAQQRMQRADQALIGEIVDGDGFVHRRRRALVGGRQRTERAGAGGQAVELAEAFEQRRGELIDGGACRADRAGSSVASPPTARISSSSTFKRLLAARDADHAPVCAARAPAPRRGQCRAMRR